MKLRRIAVRGTINSICLLAIGVWATFGATLISTRLPIFHPRRYKTSSIFSIS